MPPKQARAAPDESRSEASSTREKPANPAIHALNGKGRRNGNGASSSRDVSHAGPSSAHAQEAATGGAGNLSTPDGPGGIQWSSFDASVLHAYRHAYRLNTPAAFSNSYNQLLLSRSSFGKMSPTMARKKEQRRQGKEQLASACRKHFNGLGIQENEVVVDFLYKIRFQDKKFRMRFGPNRPR